MLFVASCIDKPQSLEKRKEIPRTTVDWDTS